MLTHLTDLIRGSWHYAAGLRGFLSTTIDFEQAKATLTEQLHRREQAFLHVVKEGIYGNPRSPYKRLLQHAGYQFEDVEALVYAQGIEGALEKLHDDGVYVTLDEFKGRTPIRRPGLEVPVSAFDFDNPLLTAHYQGSTSGSRGGGTRVDIHFDFLALEAASTICYLTPAGVSKPGIMWRVAPPSSIGLRMLFILMKIGSTPLKWFSPNRPGWNRQGIQARALVTYTLVRSWLLRRSFPRPQYRPDVSAIVTYMQNATRSGDPISVNCGPSQWVRICLAAEEAGADIAGTVFWGGGEPYTMGKATVLERLGCRGLVSYGMHEVGTVGLACSAGSPPDDMHILKDKVAVIQRPLRLGADLEVQSLVHTSLIPTSPKLLLNVESGDYGVIEERDCGCLWQELGFTSHIHSVRSYEKLTSEGVMFMGSMLHELLEEILPARLGGGPLDYQLVEEEEEGQTHVSIVVPTSISSVSDQEVIDAVLHGLSFADWSRRQAELWRQNHTLRVLRRPPYTNFGGKVLPLHVLTPATPATK